ncbi:MAG TPA: FAD-dependent oxidoreductase [Rhodothermales bacterium]
MADGNDGDPGPDLAAGIPLLSVPDGSMISGHVGEDSVLLAHSGNEWFAIGGTCTHYGGPLAEGLLDGDTVRCPWHHACFSLRTGEALRAPALNPVPCWTVRVAGDQVFVERKRERPAVPAVTTPASDAETFVILGTGAAGHAAAEMLRREGFEGRLVLLGSDTEVPYDRPNLSKDYLAGTAPEEWIPLRPLSFYDEHGIELRLGVRAASLDPGERILTLEGGAMVRFDRLLLATGAEPVRLPLPGAELPHVHYLRTLADSRAIIAETTSAKRAVVVGAGFIGLEVAASLRTRGLEVHVVAPESIPMERIVGADLGRFVQRLHEEHGVVFHLGDSVTAIAPAAVTLRSGGTLPVDLVVIGVGVRPATSIAEAAGLQVDNGVVVDDYLETSVPGIFAAGDIARWPYRGADGSARVEHWVVAQRQGQTAARNMLGRRQRFDAVPFFWSQHYDVPICYVGNAREWDRIDVAGSIADRDCILAYRANGRTLAVASIYRDHECLEAERALERSDEGTLARLIPPN